MHRPRYNDWSIPKGKLKDGEDIPAAAVREVEEETGVPIRLGQPLGAVSYTVADNKKKVSYFWAATPLEDDSPIVRTRPKVKRAPSSEIDEVAWVSGKDAYKLLTMESDRDLLGILLDQWEDRKLETWTMVLVRHGQALKRSQWKKGKGAEETRPLTKRGQIQAAHLTGILSAFGVEHLHSSPWLRCASTLEPYAKKLRTEVVTFEEMTEASHEKKPKKVAKIIDHELSHRTVPVAMCVHRPTMPTIVDVFTKRAPYSIMKKVPKSDPYLKPGELLIAHIAAPRGRKASIVALEKMRPSSIDRG